jgi:hypothetical protein
MGYPAATERGTSRTDASRTRDLAPTAFRRRNSSGISLRRKAVGSSSRSTGIAGFFLRALLGATGERGEEGRGVAAGSETRGGVR